MELLRKWQQTANSKHVSRVLCELCDCNKHYNATFSPSNHWWIFPFFYMCFVSTLHMLWFLSLLQLFSHIIVAVKIFCCVYFHFGCVFLDSFFFSICWCFLTSQCIWPLTGTTPLSLPMKLSQSVENSYWLLPLGVATGDHLPCHPTLASSSVSLTLSSFTTSMSVLCELPIYPLLTASTSFVKYIHYLQSFIQKILVVTSAKPLDT